MGYTVHGISELDMNEHVLAEGAMWILIIIFLRYEWQPFY